MLNHFCLQNLKRREVFVGFGLLHSACDIRKFIVIRDVCWCPVINLTGQDVCIYVLKFVFQQIFCTFVSRVPKHRRGIVFGDFLVLSTYKNDCQLQ